MANIETYLNTIANGVYGRDVRAAIVNAIRQCYADGKAGAIDEQARRDIATIKNQIGTANISKLGTTLTESILTSYDNQYFNIEDPENNYVNIGIHDWLNGMFTAGAASFHLPLDKRLKISYPRERYISDSGKPLINVEFAKVHPNDNELRSIGSNGWRTIPLSSISVRSAVVTYNRSALLVVLNCPTALQPICDDCLISLDATFTFTDGT